jgi:hypothetical protein
MLRMSEVKSNCLKKEEKRRRRSSILLYSIIRFPMPGFRRGKVGPR